MLTDLRFFSPEDSLEKFAVKWILNDPPHLAYVATRRCETLTSAKQAINDKLQGSVATYWRCGGVYCWVCEWNFLIGEYLQNYKPERGCLMHFARLANTLLKDEESERDNHVFAGNFAQNSPILIFFHSQTHQ